MTTIRARQIQLTKTRKQRKYCIYFIMSSPPYCTHIFTPVQLQSAEVGGGIFEYLLRTATNLSFNHYVKITIKGKYFNTLYRASFFLFCTMTNKCTQLFHKLSHCYIFRHYCVILRELVVSTLPSYTIFQMQLLVIEFTIKMLQRLQRH